jgi:hypothetical protein
MKLFFIRAVRAIVGGWKFLTHMKIGLISLVVRIVIMKPFALMICPIDGGEPIND